MRWLLNLFKFTFFCLICIAVFVFFFLNAGFTAVGPGPAREVHVEKGSNGVHIAHQLEEAHLIKSAIVFEVMMKLSKTDGMIQAGDYTVSPADDSYTILRHMVNGDRVVRRVTFTEGQTAQQMGLTAESYGICKSDEFLKVVQSPPEELREGLSHGGVEGFLFPDTYEIQSHMRATDLVKMLVDHFDQKVLPLWQQHRGKVSLSLHDMITLASLVEREAQVPQERPLIAGVLYHRLKQGMPLQCDASVQYALGKQKPVLSLKDLEIDSPYNTYKHKGLPPGPIGNPGLSCIEAAMEPTPTEYLFYVRNDKKNDGSHVFTKTYEEHQAAIRTYQNP